MKHNTGWIIILLGALIVALTSCNSAPSYPATKSDSTLIYEWSESGNHFYIRKITVDGQEYIMASTAQGVAITPHWAFATISGSGEMASPYEIQDTITIDTGKIITGQRDAVSGGGTVRELTYKEQKEFDSIIKSR